MCIYIHEMWNVSDVEHEIKGRSLFLFFYYLHDFEQTICGET